MEEKIDARKLPREVIEKKPLHADTVGRWLRLSKKQLKINRGGRKPGEGRHLTCD